MTDKSFLKRQRTGTASSVNRSAERSTESSTELPAGLRTRVLVVDPVSPLDRDLQPAADLLRSGQVVAFPTETVYGLGANALDPDAVQAIFTAKGRPADNPLIVHVADRADLPRLVSQIAGPAAALVDRFMPGPLTLVLPRSPIVPDIVTAGLDTVAVRIPEHPVARRLIELAGVPVAAPSANRSGRPSPTTAAHVLEDMDGIIPLVVDGGACDFGLESTVVDVTGPVPVILRPGAVSAEEIMAVVGPIRMADSAQAEAVARAGIKRGQAGLVDSESGPSAGQPAISEKTLPAAAAPRSPGMKYRHYAPRTPVMIAEGPDPVSISRQLVSLVLQTLAAGRTPAVYASKETVDLLAASLKPDCRLTVLDASDTLSGRPKKEALTNQASTRLIQAIAHGTRGQSRTAASGLFAALRRLDACQADVIIAEGAEATGIGAAYVNRLRKAAVGGSEPADGSGPVQGEAPAGKREKVESAES